MEIITPVQTENPPSILKLYNPAEYFFMGLILSLIPVFVMSFSNSKLIPNGDVIRKKMKGYLMIFIILMVSHIGLLTWSTVTVVSALYSAISEDPYAAVRLSIAEDSYLSRDSIVEDLIPKETEGVKKIMDNANLIYLVLNTLLLILVARYTKKNELPVVKELKEKKLAVSRSMIIPALAGLTFIAALIFGFQPLLMLITEALL